MADHADLLHAGRLIKYGRMKKFRQSEAKSYNYLLRSYGILQCTDNQTSFKVRDMVVDEMYHSFHFTIPNRETLVLTGANGIEFENWRKAFKRLQNLTEGADFEISRTKFYEGSIANFYNGRRKKDAKPVVEKVIDRRNLTMVSAWAEATFVKEMFEKFLKNDTYPKGLVKVYEVYHTPKDVHIICEHLNGTTLESFVQGRRRLSEPDAHKIFKQVYHVILDLHRQNLVHGGVTCRNIMVLDKDLKIKLFGFSSVSLVDDRGACISPYRSLEEYCGLFSKDGCAYLAPEIWHGSNTSTQADFWSLGCVLYYMLVGKLPFEVGEQRMWRQGQRISRNETLRLYANEKRIDKAQKMLFPEKSEKCKTLTTNAKSILYQLLNPEPRQRMSHINVTNHPWFRINSHQRGAASSSKSLRVEDYFD